MSKCDRAAVDVHFLEIESEFLDTIDVLGSERFVDL